VAVFLDLDNTLVDRDGAFQHWARVSVRAWGGDDSDIAWLIRADANGYTARVHLAQMILGRLHPPVGDIDDLVDRLLYEHVEYVECYDGVLAQLEQLAASGVPLIVVTNGDATQQRMKLRRTGLDQVVNKSVISSVFGFKKPDARMFAEARKAANDDGETWMVGDHIEADIAGARAVGCSTAWVSHGRSWSKEWQPTLTADRTVELLALLNHRISAIHSSTPSAGCPEVVY
jgi:HAD superfamily hydrolase (TIGR01662 family)